MTTVHKSIHINAPLDRVYAYITDPRNMPEVWPSMIAIHNVDQKPDGAYSFDWEYKMAGVRFRGHSDAHPVEPKKHVVIKAESGIPNTFDYQYQAEDGGTRVSLTVEYTLPSNLLGKLSAPFLERLNEHEAEITLNNTKARLEMGD